jgi:hypothetical protein
MNRDAVDFHAAQNHFHGHSAQGRARPLSRENVLASPRRIEFFENRQRLPRQRYAVRASAFHACCRHLVADADGIGDDACEAALLSVEEGGRG